MTRKDELDRELDRGRMDELPPNIPPGFLGEKGPDLRRADEFEPTLNAGIIQESTWETRWLVIWVAYLLIITSPVAFYLLWRERRRSLLTKILVTVVMLAGYVAVLLSVRSAG